MRYEYHDEQSSVSGGATDRCQTIRHNRPLREYPRCPTRPWLCVDLKQQRMMRGSEDHFLHNFCGHISQDCPNFIRHLRHKAVKTHYSTTETRPVATSYFSPTTCVPFLIHGDLRRSPISARMLSSILPKVGSVSSPSNRSLTLTYLPSICPKCILLIESASLGAISVKACLTRSSE
jgi:hypothetical protein